MTPHPIRHLLQSLDQLARGFFRAFVWVYQLALSPVLHSLGFSGCRFHPTCSRYCAQCFAAHSTPRALWLSLRRVLRCHPWARGGFDPAPSPPTMPPDTPPSATNSL